MGDVSLNQKIGAQKNTAIRYNACGMNMPMGYGRGDSRSFQFRFRMGVGGDMPVVLLVLVTLYLADENVWFVAVWALVLNPLPSFFSRRFDGRSGGCFLNQKIGAQKNTAIRYNACDMNMPMGDGRGGVYSRSFSVPCPYGRCCW